jgi:hypothetical protein
MPTTTRSATGCHRRLRSHPQGTPLQASIEIRKALNLSQLERVEEAQKL